MTIQEYPENILRKKVYINFTMKKEAVQYEDFFFFWLFVTSGIDNRKMICYSSDRTDKTISALCQNDTGGIVYEHFQIHTEIHGSCGTVPEAGP